MAYLVCETPQAIRRAVRTVVANGERQATEWLGFQVRSNGTVHVLQRTQIPSKDPSLRSWEVRGICENIDDAFVDIEHGDPTFFRAVGSLESSDWIGNGRVLFHILAESDSGLPFQIMVTTAFRESGWRPKR